MGRLQLHLITYDMDEKYAWTVDDMWGAIQRSFAAQIEIYLIPLPLRTSYLPSIGRKLDRSLFLQNARS